jgi:hypothetical protein
VKRETASGEGGTLKRRLSEKDDPGGLFAPLILRIHFTGSSK